MTIFAKYSYWERYCMAYRSKIFNSSVVPAENVSLAEEKFKIYLFLSQNEN